MNDKTFTFFVLLFLNSHLITSSLTDYFQYTDPMPGSIMINKETSIIIVPSTSLENDQFTNFKTLHLLGSLSGKHE
jgi:hypothetical protein